LKVALATLKAPPAAESEGVMSKVLIGIAAAIVLAGAMFAVVHFSAGRKPVAAAPQNGWTLVKDAPSVARRNRDVVGTFGAWRLLCPVVTPVPGNPTPAQATAPARHCAIALLMRNRGTRGEWINLRFQKPVKGSGAVMVLFYAHGHAGETFATAPKSPGDEVGVAVDKITGTMHSHGCRDGICLTIAELAPSGLKSLLSAQTLAIRLPQTKSAKAAEVNVPTDGLKAAFAALQRQPS
jgi:invasion protein IalB